MNSIAFRINLLKDRIQSSLSQSCRPENAVKILAVSKTRSTEEIKKAFAAGIQHFGENRLQEALIKQEILQEYPIIWHFIGRIQHNKVKKIAQQFHWVESIACEKIAQRFSDTVSKTATTLNVCLQVNIDNDPKKAGVPAHKVKDLASFVRDLPGIKLRGLMTVLEKHSNLQDDKNSYHKMKQLFDSLNQSQFNLDTLSMGMSGDFAVAIAEGATQIRIGKNLFGPFEEEI
jgi:pyridoxal phosphate enzyme (YggS family)